MIDLMKLILEFVIIMIIVLESIMVALLPWGNTFINNIKERKIK
jgi:hypothetical protein